MNSSKINKKYPTIQNQITKLFLGFTLTLSLVYSLLLLGYSWVVEDNIFNRLVKNEAQFIVDYYYQNGQITAPRSDFINLYSSWNDLPGNIAHLHQLDPNRIEFESPIGDSLHVKPIVLGSKSFVLAANVSAFEVGKDYLPIISLWLIVIVIIISSLALLVSIFISKRAIKPLKHLTQKVATSHSAKIDDTFSDEFPNNEVGYLAKTFQSSILHLQEVLQRESDFTRDASHELRTPITILRNIKTKLKKQGGLDSLDNKNFKQFSYAVSQLQLTVTTLLALAREESVQAQELKLLAVLEDCIINHYELSQNKEFELFIDIPASYKVKANQNLLKILLNNLLSNAINYASRNSLTIKAIGTDIYFENKASTHPPSEPFKAHSRGEDSMGIGLGLNLVKRLCSSFGWQVNLKNNKENFCIVISIN